MRHIFEGTAPELRELLADIYRLTSIKICLFDRDGSELCYYPERFCRLCTGLRMDPSFDARCRRCDEAARRECAATNTAMIYTCHAGLTECIAPISIAGEISGYIVLGQIRQTEHLAVLESAPRGELHGVFAAMPLVPEETIVSALHIVQACAEYERLKQYMEETAQSFPLRFRTYVARRLPAQIGVGDLMREFRLSRVELYRKVNEAFGQSPSAYVREQRLLMARELVTESSCSIAQAAERCGIGDYNYFAKMFKKRFGCSARQMRKAGAKEKNA